MTAYFAGKPDPAVPSQRVAFGTSGHRGSAFNNAFNEAHILAISQAICDHRRASGIGGPLFVGIDTHALAEPALASAGHNSSEPVQFERQGYFCPDPDSRPEKLVFNRTVGLRDTWAKVQAAS